MVRPLKRPPLHLLPIRPKGVASRVSSGRNLFAEGGDGRTAWGRRWRDLCLSHANDLGGTGILSEAQVSIIKRVSAIECELEGMEASMSVYGRLAGRLCRMFELIGIQRLAEPLDPQSALVQALGGTAAAPIDDDDDENEPASIEEGLDKTEPGEA